MSVQNIHRSTHSANYTVLPNAIWQSGLSVAATSALGYILSRPPNWVIRITDLRNKLRLGRDKVYRTLQELCAAGYAKMTRLQRGVRWEFFDTPQIFETSDTTEPKADSRLPEIKLTKGREALERNEIPLVSIEEKQLQAAPVTLNDPAPKKESVVASNLIEQPVTTLTTLTDPEIVKAIEKLPLPEKQRKVAERTLSNLSLPEVKAILSIFTRALTLNSIQNPIGYLVGLRKACLNGTLTPVVAQQQETIAQRLNREAEARRIEAKRGAISNDGWAKMMIDRLGLEAFLKIAPWYNVPQ